MAALRFAPVMLAGLVLAGPAVAQTEMAAPGPVSPTPPPAATAAPLSGKAEQARTAALLAQAMAALDQYRQALDKESAKSLDLQADRDRWKLAAEKAQAASTACAARNAELVTVANEILAAYRKVGVTDVLRRKEPFLGLKRVRIENLAQDMGDKVYAARCDARAPTPAPPTPAPATTPGG